MPPVPTGEIVLAAHLVDPHCVRAGRVPRVQRVHVGQENQQIGMDQGGHQRREPIVVAEPDLVGGDRVVFVDDRHGAEVEQLGQSSVGVAVVRAPGDVVEREQHLSDRPTVTRETGGVPADELSLPDAGRGLLGGQVARPAAAPERR
jgi:hypothetical protein